MKQLTALIPKVPSPIAQLSIFGWLILGPVAPNSSVNHYHIHHATTITNYEDIQELLTKFWVQEEVPMSNQHQLSSLDQQCEDFFKSTHSRHSSGRYIEELGHMRPAPTHNQDSQDIHPYFLPHYGVLRPSSTTTELRVVFNGSSPSSTGVSLNDITYTGAKIQLDIFDVLLWVRQHQYVFATDITKMYRQIMVHHEDWKLQQILWLDNHNKIIPYQLTTVTYGTRSAPYLAVRVLLQLVEDEGHKYPKATQTIIEGRHVDDIFGGADSPEELIQVAEKFIYL
ncbi:uncharacterized protein [Chelonus insularis]|uniref:uncharacterized protein n=1 Tax=Chelonus insularis TaxID=460826 RepID=UPI00158B5AE1|nr:uncharacterized protein LOC118066582 [Chelonus insularis]